MLKLKHNHFGLGLFGYAATAGGRHWKITEAFRGSRRYANDKDQKVGWRVVTDNFSFETRTLKQVREILSRVEATGELPTVRSL